MRRVISIFIVLGLLLGMIFAVTACPKTEQPGAGGTVSTQPQLPPMQPIESEIPEGAVAPDQPPAEPAPPAEGGEAAPPAEGGEAAPPAPAPPAEGGE